MMELVVRDPIIIAAFALTTASWIGYLLGRTHGRYDRIERVLTLNVPDGTGITANTTGGRADDESPNAHVDLGN